MNFNTKYLNKLVIVLMAFLSFATFSCDIEEIPDPNNPSLSGIALNASRSDLNLLVTGIESLLANDINFYYDVSGIIGREFYFFTSADVRFTGEILGKENLVLDNAGFYGTRPWQGRYRTIRNANILIDAVNVRGSALSLTTAETNAYLGYAKAMQAYELHIALMLQYENGIRMDVSDPDNLGAFVSYDEAIDGILALFDEAISNLSNAGDEFPFTLSSGFDDFDTPYTFIEFVNGLAGRIAIYKGDKSGAKGYLSKSFLDMGGDFDEGPVRYYSTAGGEQINELFRTLDGAEALVAHPSFITDLQANPNDARNSKIVARSAPASSDGLTSDYDVNVYTSFDANLPFMRNEELILLMAEANIGSDNVAALSALNIIRTGNGLDPVTLSTDDELTDELLEQRRFSLFFEGHRWVDMRRYGRLGQLPLDRTNDDVWDRLPRPVSEEE